MDLIDIIKKKIVEIENNLTDIKNCLTKLEIKEKPKSTPKQDNQIPSDEELREEYQRLYKIFDNGNIDSIKESIGKNTIRYLKAFCKANTITIDSSKASKSKIIEKVLLCMGEHRAIRSKI